MNSRAYMKDVSEYFQIKVEFLLLVHSEPVGIFILVDKITELVHVNFRNICSDERCGIARSESKSIQDNLKCSLSLFLSRIMSSITAQQTKLDLELVPKKKRLEIRKCNERLKPGKKQREATFQVVLDTLALTPCYSASLITADVPEVYMHQFCDFIHKYENSYRFRMDKKKKFDLNLEIF
nr:hypothetical protein [Tanacetum cinerariifolium]